MAFRRRGRRRRSFGRRRRVKMTRPQRIGFRM